MCGINVVGGGGGGHPGGGSKTAREFVSASIGDKSLKQKMRTRWPRTAPRK